MTAVTAMGRVGVWKRFSFSLRSFESNQERKLSWSLERDFHFLSEVDVVFWLQLQQLGRRHDRLKLLRQPRGGTTKHNSARDLQGTHKVELQSRGVQLRAISTRYPQGVTIKQSSPVQLWATYKGVKKYLLTCWRLNVTNLKMICSRWGGLWWH